MKTFVRTIVLAGILLLSGCQDIELGPPKNPNALAPEDANLDLLFNAVQLSFAEFNNELSNKTMPYVRMTALQNSSTYYQADRPENFDRLWDLAYTKLS